MFILLPAIFIFLLLSYVYLNDLSLLTEIIIYLVSSVIGVFTYIIYRKIKYDLKLQEINALEAEIITLEKRCKNTEDNTLKISYQKTIESIKKEIDSKL